ncbi:MAG: tRNA (adenosine(37)-N6)-dimethylallyltransferase MiaA, partial [Candidatus Nealsonbacteria bacterium]|nr:tRNA (adenosine(37)-N6)-dimethylallyltransferase MiaA [Candidatus Nealsonbacteria bacterium]
ADSRQVYKGMDIGTGKITKKEMKGIPHHLLDIASPNVRFTVTKFKELGKKAILNIIKKNKLPFIVGGTGFYIDSLINDNFIPEVKPDWKLRKKLEKLTNQQLFARLKKLDKRRAKNIDRNNPRRLIRAIEIVLKTKMPVPLIKAPQSKYNVLFLGIKRDKEELKKLIHKRLIERLNAGMLNEAKKLRKTISFKKMEEFGLEYRYMALYLQKKITYDEFVSRLEKEIEHYAKRQMTWFKRNRRIHWIKNKKEAMKSIDKFMQI